MVVMFASYSPTWTPATHPSLSLVVNIGRVAYCDAAYDCGSVNDHITDAGYKIPNLKRGQRMIIAQVPACNPIVKHSKDMNTVHKARFVLVHLVWEYDEKGETFVVDSALSLVDYALLRILDPSDEATLREKLIWNTGAREELTSLGVVASRLMEFRQKARTIFRPKTGTSLS
jgi:hypothetical protein